MPKYFHTFLTTLSVLLFIILINNSVWALSPLPKNAYPQYKDNLKEVKILQEILNSDQETLIASEGVGSPGRENWFFGALTLDALKRFQQKYGLEVTGKVDFKTWTILNKVVNNEEIVIYDSPVFSETESTITNPPKPITQETDEVSDNQFLGNTENPYLGDSTTSENSSSATPTKKTYLDTILEKYSSIFSALTNRNLQQNSQSTNQTTGDRYSNSYSQQTPYYNPQTGVYSSNPSYAQQGPAGSTLNPAFSYNNPANTNPYLSGGGSGLQQYFPGDYNSRTPGAESSAGATSGLAGDIGFCKASSFAHATYAEGCVADPGDQQNSQRPASFSKYGVYLSRSGLPAIPAVALPNRGSFGDAVEIKDMSTGKCKAFPLLDRGPAARIVAAGTCVDMTGSAVDILKGNTPCSKVGPLNGREGRTSISKVQYAIIPGEKISPGQTKECTHLK